MINYTFERIKLVRTQIFTFSVYLRKYIRITIASATIASNIQKPYAVK